MIVFFVEIYEHLLAKKAIYAIHNNTVSQRYYFLMQSYTVANQALKSLVAIQYLLAKRGITSPQRAIVLVAT